MDVKPGTYRLLFTKALLLLIQQSETTEQEKFECNHYIDLLADKDYVFGKPEIITMLKRQTKDH